MSIGEHGVPNLIGEAYGTIPYKRAQTDPPCLFDSPFKFPISIPMRGGSFTRVWANPIQSSDSDGFYCVFWNIFFSYKKQIWVGCAALLGAINLAIS